MSKNCMLAHPFKKRAHNIVWPAMVQPKLNGVRCIVKKTNHGTFEFTSRTGKPYVKLDHLHAQLDASMKIDELFDGELFSPDLTFQEIVAAVNTSGSITENTPKIQLWVYDVVAGIGFKSRCEHYHNVIAAGDGIVPVKTTLVERVDDMMALHAQHVADGFEGTIVRNVQGGYKFGRSADLQKYKDFLDAEFKIVGATEGTGAASGTVVWKCSTGDGQEFGVVPKGTIQARQDAWNRRESIFGKMLTVKYQNLSDGGVPIFPVGISIRDYEG